MGVIATEQQAAAIGGGSPYTNNKCATKTRALELGCAVSGSYANNQLVEYGSLSNANVGISSFPILYTNYDQSSYQITTNILSYGSGWIPYLIRVIPKNYFGTSVWSLYASRWLMIAPPMFWELYSDDNRYGFWPSNGNTMNSLYNGYNTGNYANRGGYHYFFPNTTNQSGTINWNLNNGWPLKADSLRTYNGTSPMYGIAHCNAYMSSADFGLIGSNGQAYFPTLAELLVIMYNFNAINNIIGQLQSVGWGAGSLIGVWKQVYKLPYCNYLSNTYGPYGMYYARPITGDGGIRPSYIYNDDEIISPPLIVHPQSHYITAPCYSTGNNVQVEYCGNKKFNMLAIVDGDDWQLDCMSDNLDRVYN